MDYINKVIGATLNIKDTPYIIVEAELYCEEDPLNQTSAR